LQIDAQGNSSTATRGRITGFGGAPNMGVDPRGRRHDGQEGGETLRERKLVVQMVQTRQPSGAPSFVERLDAFDLAASAAFALPPVMIYGDDVTHVITERGVANLLRCRSPQEREAALRVVAGDTDFGKRQSPEAGDSLRRRHRGVSCQSRHRCCDGAARLARGQDDRRLRNGFRRSLRAAGELPSPPGSAECRPTHTRLSNGNCHETEHANAVQRGEASGALVARQLHEALGALDASDRYRFQCYVATEFQPDKAALRAAAERYLADGTAEAGPRSRRPPIRPVKNCCGE
jgi:hypothetical protein